MTDKINFPRYALLFAGSYAALLLISNIIIAVLALEAGNSLSVGILIASIIFSAGKFAKEQQRKPERREKFIISLLCLGATLAISISGIIIVSLVNNISLTEMIAGFSLGLLLLSLTIVILIYWAVIYFTFGWFAAFSLKRQQKKS